MSWEPGQPLVRKLGGVWRQLPRSMEDISRCSLLSIKEDKRLIGWLGEKRQGASLRETRKGAIRPHKKGGETLCKSKDY